MLNKVLKDDEFYPIENFFAFARTHGVGKVTLLRWAKKGFLRKMYRVVDSKGRVSYVVNSKEVKHLILTRVHIGSIEHLFTIIWTEKLERMIHQSMNMVRKKWNDFFCSDLPPYQKNIESCYAFFELRPKVEFFKENENIIRRIPKKYHDIYLELISKNKVIEKEKDKNIRLRTNILITKKEAIDIVHKNSISIKWFYKRMQHKNIFVVKSKRAFFIDKELLEFSILQASKIVTIENLFHSVWSYSFAEKMSSLRHSEWKRCFSNAREKTVLSYVEAKDFFALRPTYYFFKVHMESILSFLPDKKGKIFIELMSSIQETGKKIIEECYIEQEKKKIVLEKSYKEQKKENKAFNTQNEPNYEYILQGLYNYLIYNTDDVEKYYKELYNKTCSAKELTQHRCEFNASDVSINNIIKDDGDEAADSNSSEECILRIEKEQHIYEFITSICSNKREQSIFSLFYDGYKESEIVKILKLDSTYNIKKTIKQIQERAKEKLPDSLIL